MLVYRGRTLVLHASVSEGLAFQFVERNFGESVFLFDDREYEGYFPDGPDEPPDTGCGTHCMSHKDPTLLKLVAEGMSEAYPLCEFRTTSHDWPLKPSSVNEALMVSAFDTDELHMVCEMAWDLYLGRGDGLPPHIVEKLMPSYVNYLVLVHQDTHHSAYHIASAISDVNSSAKFYARRNWDVYILSEQEYKEYFGNGMSHFALKPDYFKLPYPPQDNTTLVAAEGTPELTARLLAEFPHEKFELVEGKLVVYCEEEAHLDLIMASLMGIQKELSSSLICDTGGEEQVEIPVAE